MPGFVVGAPLSLVGEAEVGAPDVQPLPIEEESDAWWAGAARCFVAVPLAGAVTALALSASLAWGYQQQTEDIVPPPPTVEEAYWPAPVLVEEPRLLSLWGSGGAASAPPPVVAPAEEPHPLAWVRPAAAAPPAFPLWADDDLPVTPFVPDEDIGGLLQPGLSRAAPLSPAAAWAVDDDAVPALGVDESAWDLWTPPAARPSLVLFLADEEIVPPPAAFPPEEDSWVPLAPRVAAWSAPWAVDDEIVPQPVPGVAEEDLWPLPRPRAVAARPPYLPDPEALPAGVLFGVPEEDAWPLPLGPRARAAASVALADDEIVPQPLVGDDDAWGWPPSPRIVPPIGTTWAVDEAFVPAPVPSEDYWQAPVIWQARPAAGVGWVDDEIVPIPMPTEDYWQRPVVWPFRPVPVAMVADDEIAFVASSVTLLRVADEVAGRPELIGALPQTAGLDGGQAGHIHMTDETGV